MKVQDLFFFFDREVDGSSGRRRRYRLLESTDAATNKMRALKRSSKAANLFAVARENGGGVGVGDGGGKSIASIPDYTPAKTAATTATTATNAALSFPASPARARAASSLDAFLADDDDTADVNVLNDATVATNANAAVTGDVDVVGVARGGVAIGSGDANADANINTTVAGENADAGANTNDNTNVNASGDPPTVVDTAVGDSSASQATPTMQSAVTPEAASSSSSFVPPTEAELRQRYEEARLSKITDSKSSVLENKELLVTASSTSTSTPLPIPPSPTSSDVTSDVSDRFDASFEVPSGVR
jgi:hypothetical protein